VLAATKGNTETAYVFFRHVAKAIELDQHDEVAMLKFDTALAPQQAVVYVKFTGVLVGQVLLVICLAIPATNRCLFFVCPVKLIQ
jgi:hypothetical protein